MKNITYTSLILTLLLSISFTGMSQIIDNTGDNNLDDGINERPAIANLIEIWSPREELSSTLIILDTNDQNTINDTKSTSSTAVLNADNGANTTTVKGDGDDIDHGNGPQVLPIREKRSVIHEDASLILYPNPATAEINISLKNSDVKEIEIFNMNGSCIYKCSNGIPASQFVRIDLNDTARGIYMLHVTGTESISTKKFALR